MAKNALASIERTPILNGINRIGRTLKIVGINPFKLNADKIIANAKKKAAFTEPIPQQLELGLRKMIESINSEAKPNTFVL